MNKQFGKKILAVLAAAAIPFTTMLSSAPLANAAGSNVTFNTKTSSVVSSGTNGSTTINGRNIAKDKNGYLDYEYTGNIFTAKSSLYDYLSDNEVNGIGRYSTAAGYADPYVQLNRAISEYNISVASPSSENLTIRYKPAKEKEGRYINRYYVSVYLFQEGTGNNNGWPGKNMTYDAANEEFVYTIRYSDIGFSPNKFVISYTSKDSNDKDKSEKTGDIGAALSKGKAYRYEDGGSVSEIGNADTIYNKGSNYNVPLYFGCFYLDDDPDHPDIGNEADHYQGYNKADGTYKGRAHTNYYQNFYWQANLSLRNDNNGNVNFDASVQGLVDNTLTNDTITQNGKTLPYFSDEWADNHSNLVKYWHNIAFPFYEIDVDAAKVYGEVADSEHDKYVAKYYQFNSKEGDKYSLYFQPDNANKTGTYQETKTAIVSQPTTTSSKGTISYLPFNSKNDYERNALGFGMNFEMDFQIRADGKVYTYDKNTGKPTGKSVNATFEFMGDDDVWVFIDDKLVLDLGGAHKDTTGIIDFAERKAYANDAITFGAGKGRDDLSGNLSSQKVVNLKDVMVSDTFNADNTYNEEKVHTLKMFYMERGMYESDLLVRFNFSAIPNKNTLKVREITNFTGINKGLVSLTKQAADYDVFNYTASNTGTAKEDVGESGITTPTYNYYQRQNEENKSLTANLTGSPLAKDTTHVYLQTDKNIDDNKWTSKNAIVAAYMYGGTGTPKTVLGEKVGDDLYRFESEGYTKLDFVRVSSDFSGSFPYSGYVPDGSVWNKVQFGNFTQGATYKITGWGSASLVTDTPRDAYEYSENNFNPNNGTAVKNVNYIWTDEFAVKTSGSQPDGMTGTTDNTGSFNLMYGTVNNESSAFFNAQFKKDSTMAVSQNDILNTVKRDGSIEDFSTTKGRSVSKYYDTTVSIVDKNNESVANNGTVTNTSYTYNNNDDTSPVQITETFTNTPRVGALSVSKALEHGDTVDDTFTFTVQFEDIFGISEVQMTADDYANVVVSVDGTEFNLDAFASFAIKGGQTAVISGIPYGTKYTVTETDTSENYQSVGTNSFTGTVGEDNTVSVYGGTVTNTRLTNSLTLSKSLLGTYTDEDEDKLFTFSVTLTAPAGVNLSNYSISGASLGTYNLANGTYTFNVSVSKNAPVTISGIPYGTEYSVSEPSTPENWICNSGTIIGVINSNPSAVKMTNTYEPPVIKYGSLTVSKNVLTSTNSEEIADSEKTRPFTFTVTLYNGADAVNDTFPTSAGTDITFTDGSATFTLCDDESLTISDINAGFTYTVSEQAESDYELISPTGVVSGTIEEDAEAVASFTNRKIFIPYTLPDAGFEDMRAVYILLLSGMMLFGLAYWYVNREKVKKN